MTTLPDAPAELLDPQTLEPRFGSYVGNLPLVDFAAAGFPLHRRIRHEKRWSYVLLASDEVIVCAAVVRLGYASNAFAFAFDRITGHPLAEWTSKGPAVVASVGKRAGEGARASYRLGSKFITFHRPFGSKNYEVNVFAPGFKLDAIVSTEGAPRPLSVVAKLRGDLFSTTEKAVLLRANGSLLAGGKRFELKDAYAGYDYTAGMLERRTAWKWALGMGHLPNGKRVAFNLTQGFVGERECVAWVDDDVHHLSAMHFTFDPNRVMQPWHIHAQNGSCDVDFEPTHVHAESHNLVVVRSNFKQIAGKFRGRLVLPNQGTISFENMLGVTEDQDTTW